MIFNTKIRLISATVKVHVLISGYKRTAKYEQDFILLFMEFSDILIAKHFSINFDFSNVTLCAPIIRYKRPTAFISNANACAFKRGIRVPVMVSINQYPFSLKELIIFHNAQKS